MIASTALTSSVVTSGGRVLLGEQPTLSAPLAPAPILIPAPILGPAIARPFLPNSPDVYGYRPLIDTVPTGYPTVTTGGVDTQPAPAIVQPPPPVLPQRPRVLPGPSQPIPSVTTVPGNPVTTVFTPRPTTTSPLEQLKRVPWWGVAAALVGLAVLFGGSTPHTAAA